VKLQEKINNPPLKVIHRYIRTKRKNNNRLDDVSMLEKGRKFFKNIFKKENTINQIDMEWKCKSNLNILDNIQDKEIEDQIKWFPSDTAYGLDGITAIDLKKISESEHKTKFYDLIRKQIKHGLSKNLSEAYLILLHKKGDINNFSNYRPLMVTNIFCRLINKIINERLQNFILKENLINEKQYGFIRGRGTQLARTKLMEFITKLQSK